MSACMPSGHHGSALLLVVCCTLVRATVTDAADACETDGVPTECKSNLYIQRIIHASSAVAAMADGSIAQIPVLGKAVMGAGEMWKRIRRQLFSPHNRTQILEKMEEAPAAELATTLTEYTWDLEVVAAVLKMLKLRFASDEDKCIVVDVIGKEWWSSVSSHIEAKSITAPYLSECLAYASSDTRSVIAKNCARLLVETRGGATGRLTPQLIGYTLELVSLTVDETTATSEEMAADWKDLAASSALEDTSVQFAKVSYVDAMPFLPLSEIASTYTAAMTALRSGHEAACDAMRALLRAEQSALRASKTMPSGSMVASVRDLEMLGNMETPGLCLPSLRQDLRRLVTLDRLASQVERASEIVFSKARASGHGQLEEILNSAIVGQPCAVKRVTKSARLRMGGLWGQDKPLVLLLTGPSGTGKTLMARSIAEMLLGRRIAELEASQRFRTFHMNIFSMVEDQKSFFGPPKGIVGKGDLPELLKMWPDAVILLDEVEKAHPSFARALLKVLGENGAVYDPHTGTDIPSGRATFLLTSNLAKDLILDRRMTSKDFATKDLDCNSYEALREEVMQALRAPRVRGHDNFFKESEVRGRLTDVLPFLPFGRSEIEHAVRRFLSSESAIFKKSPEFLHVSLAWQPEVVVFLSSAYAQRPEEGLRGVHTQVHAQVREILQLAIETGLVSKFGEVLLWVRRGIPSSLDLRVSSATPRLDAKHGDVDGASSREDTLANSTNSQIWPGWIFSTSTSERPGISERSGSSEMSGANLEGSNVQWLWAQDWDWEIFWDWVLDWAWEHWHYVALSIALIAVAFIVPWGAPAAGAAVAAPIVLAPTPAAIAAAAAAATAAPTATTAMTAAAAPCLSGILALVFPVGVTAATFFTASYAWNNRYLIIAAAFFCGIASLLLPALFKSLCRKCCPRCAAWIWPCPQEGKEKRRTSPHKLPSRRRSRMETLHRRSGLRTHESQTAPTELELASIETSEVDIFSTPREELDSPLQALAKGRRQACLSPFRRQIDLCSTLESEDRASNARSSSAVDCDTVGDILSTSPVAASIGRDSIASESVQRIPVACACCAVFFADDKFCGSCGAKRVKPKAD